ncbi:MAG: RluA family pseudouridine synthase [Patescibacteria group bacterium]
MASGQVRRYKIGKVSIGKRADVFVTEQLPKFSRSALKGLFDKNLVTLNDNDVKAGHKLSSGDTLKVDTSLLSVVPEPIDIPVIYEDKDVIVMNKPAGVLTHSKGILNTEPTVASFIEPKLTNKSLKGNRAGIVHRLDRATSGVIIAAKNESALKYLQNQFSTRKVEKTYLAVVEGVPLPAEAIVDAPIERNPKKPQTFRVGANGRPAQTRYKVLKMLSGSSNLSLLELRPMTGRTHQLRVHLKYIGHPIAGDHIYGHGDENMYLHAKSLEVTLPGGRWMKFEAAEPKIFKDFCR